MTDRHQELRRQHELLREHLAWLEREMAREGAGPPIQHAPLAPAVNVAPATVRPRVSQASVESADELLQNYAEAERHDPASLKRGCLMAFASVLGVLVLAVATAYFLFYARR